MRRRTVYFLVTMVSSLAFCQQTSVTPQIRTKLNALRSGFASHQGYRKEISPYSISGDWTEIAMLYQSEDRTWSTYVDDLKIEPNGYLRVSMDGDEAVYDLDHGNDPHDNISDADGDDTTLRFQWADRGVALFSDEHLTQEDRDDNTLGYRAFLCRLVENNVNLGYGEFKTLVCSDKEDYACRAYAPKTILQILRVFQIIVRA